MPEKISLKHNGNGTYVLQPVAVLFFKTREESAPSVNRDVKPLVLSLDVL